MLTKKPVLFLAFSVFFAASLHAANVSFLVAATEESPAGRLAAVLENSLMDAFFSEGHIVSSAPGIRLAGSGEKTGIPEEARAQYEEAKNAGMEYFLLAVIGTDGSTVYLRLFATQSGSMAGEKILTGTSWNTPGGLESLRQAAAEMAGFIR